MLFYLASTSISVDKEMVSHLYELYQNRMYITAKIIVKNDMDAEDIVHDAFIKIIDNLDRIDNENNVKTWNYIATIVKNLALDFVRKEKKITKVEMQDHYIYPDYQPEMATDLYEKQVKEEMIKAISSLEFPEKEVLYLQYYNELNSKDIAFIIEKTPANIRKISERAKKKVICRLKKLGVLYEPDFNK